MALLLLWLWLITLTAIFHMMWVSQTPHLSKILHGQMPIMAQNMDTPHPRNLIPCHPTDWWMMAPLFRLSNAGAPHPKCINKFNSNVSFKKYSLGKLMLVNHCEIELLLLTHPFNSLFSWTTWLRQHQKDKPFWILMVQEMIGWQWHQLDHMQKSSAPRFVVYAAFFIPHFLFRILPYAFRNSAYYQWPAALAE